MAKKQAEDKPSTKPGPAVLIRRTTRSMTTAGVENPSLDTGIMDPVHSKELSKKMASGKKRKGEEADVKNDASNDATGSKKATKRVKKTTTIGEQRSFVDPFVDGAPLVPEPPLSVAAHEAQSRLLNQSHTVNQIRNTAFEGQSLFTKSLLDIAPENTTGTNDPAPSSSSGISVSFAAVSSSVKQSSARTTKSKPKSTPARNGLVLNPLPPAKIKNKNTERTHRETSVALPPSRPFLAPAQFSPSSSIASTRYHPETLALSTSSLTAASNSSKPSTSNKTSQHVTDKLSSLENRLSRVEAELKSAKASEKDMEYNQSRILKDNAELMKQNEQLDSEVSELREELDAQKQTMISIHSMLETLKESGVGGDVAKTVVKAEKAVRDNAWNSGSRKTFLRLLGILNTKQLKNVIPLGAGDHYLHDTESGKNVLRPHWESNFAANSDWHQDAIDFVRKKGPNFHPALTKQTLATKTDDDILKRLAVIYKTLARAYSKSVDDPEVRASRVVVKRTARRTQRKIKKAQDRTDIRAESTMDEPVWDFLFEVIYQSTDETDAEENVDPETETSTSEEITVSTAARDWVTRPPTYRHSAVAGAVKQLNGLINTRREDTGNGDKPRNRPHGRRLGVAKEKPLPFPGKTKPIAINAIAADLLDSHPENRTARLIYGYTKEEPDDSDGHLAEVDEGDEDEDEDEGGVHDGAQSHDDDFLDPSLRSGGLASAVNFDAEQSDEDDVVESE